MELPCFLVYKTQLTIISDRCNLAYNEYSKLTDMNDSHICIWISINNLCWAEN